MRLLKRKTGVVSVLAGLKAISRSRTYCQVTDRGACNKTGLVFNFNDRKNKI